MTLAEDAQRIIEANSYLVLATVDESGHPWATPVWFAAVGREQFIWVSRPDARHSRNIAGTPAVGIVIFDSTVPEGQAEAVYVEARASEIGAAERAAALAVYSARSQAGGLPAFTESDVTGDAPHRLYRGVASQVSLLGDGDRRVDVDS